MNAQPSRVPSAAKAKKSAICGRIYVVGDDSDVRRALNILNREPALETIPFATAAHFLNQLAALEPAPVLLNITVSPMDGIRLIRALADVNTRWPTIALAGSGEKAVAERLMNVGPIIVLMKPFSAEALKLTVERALGAVSDFAAGTEFPNATLMEPRSVTDQKVAEHEVDKFRRALGPFVVAAEATRMAMAFTNATAAGNRLVFANDSFLELTGYTCAEVVGQPFDFLMSAMADPEAIERIAAQFERKEVETIEVECRRHDGRSSLLAIRINPVHDRNGNVVQHCISFVSLNEHVERERKEREALHTLYQHTPDFIITMEGPEHRFTFANDAYQLLVGDRVLLGEAVADALPEVVGQGFITLLDRVFETGEPFTADGMPVTLEGKGGPEQHFVDFIYQAVRGANGAITGIFCEGHDTTEQKLCSDRVKMLQADLIKATRASAMETMVATLAHELNQPLAAISNYAGACARLIDLDGANASKMATAVTGISAGARRVGDIIRRLRDMSEQRAVHREIFDLKAAIRESIELVQAGAWARASIDDGACRSVEIEADRVQIEQVIMNLVRNGCEAVAGIDGGKVIVSAVVKGTNAIVSVRDNGAGVSAKATARLFAHAPSTKAEGMGIGLSICRNIIEGHGGVIWLESESDGANFCFSVPIIHEI